VREREAAVDPSVASHPRAVAIDADGDRRSSPCACHEMEVYGEKMSEWYNLATAVKRIPIQAGIGVDVSYGEELDDSFVDVDPRLSGIVGIDRSHLRL